MMCGKGRDGVAREGTARDRRLDTVRSLAIIMVLVIHSAAAGLAGRAPGTADWWGALLWGAAARPAVPLFFLCSGALMLCRDISPKRLLTHNLPRIVCAMLVWAFLYRLARMAGEGITPAGLWDGVKRTLLLQHESHFYYLHILLLVYAFVPVARVFVRNASRRELEYLLAVWFVTGILFPLLRHFWPFQLVTQINTWYRMNMAYSAIGFAALGHYVRQYGGTIPLGWYRISLAAGLGITFGGCAVLSLRDGALNELFLEGMSPGPALMAFGLFGLILFGRDLPGWAARPVARLAQASFCIYLCHILFQRWFLRLGLSGGASPCVLAVPGMAVLLAVCGWLAWEVLRRVPVVKSYLI